MTYLIMLTYRNRLMILKLMIDVDANHLHAKFKVNALKYKIAILGVLLVS